MPTRAERPRPRVVHVLGRLERGGAELRTLDVLRALPAGSAEVTICVLSGLPGSLDAAYRAAGASIAYCRFGPGFPIRFARLLREVEATAVHSHVHLASGAVLAVARMAGVPVRIAHFRSSSDGRGEGLVRSAYRWLMKLLIRMAATRIVAVSRASLALAWSPGWGNDPRCAVVYSGVSLQTFASARPPQDFPALPDDALVIVQAGRFDPPKNQEFSVDVLKELQHQRDAHLLFAGRDGTSQAERVRAQVSAAGLQGRVHFLGERSDIPGILAAADVLIAPSRWEGLPGVVLEALAAGVPVVASDIPVAREVASLSEDVVTLPLSAGPAAWAAHLSRVPKLSPAVRARIREGFRPGPFVIEKAAEQHLALWEGR